MSITLIITLIVLMIVNQVLGSAYGAWKNGFSKDLFWKGVKKIAYLGIGYGALAFAAHFAAEYIPATEYISGILIEPIAKYFSKICESLRGLLSDSPSDYIKKEKANIDKGEQSEWKD